MLERCPGCSRDVPEEAAECPYCGREFETVQRKPRPRPPHPPKRPVLHPDPKREAPPEGEVPPERRRLKSAFFLFLGASALFGGYFGRQYLRRAPAPAGKPAAAGPRFQEPLLEPGTRPRYPEPFSQPQAPQTGPVFEYQPGPAPHEVAQKPKGPPKPELPPPMRVVSAPCAKRGPVKGMGRNEWCLGGRVFDLRTLAPAPGAKLIFRDTTGRGLYVETDAKGRYGIPLPSNMEGYSLEIRHPDFGPRYIEDWVPSLQTFKEKKRAETAEYLSQGPHEPETVFGAEGQRFSKDYVLFKESPRQAASGNDIRRQPGSERPTD